MPLKRSQPRRNPRIGYNIDQVGPPAWASITLLALLALAYVVLSSVR